MLIMSRKVGETFTIEGGITVAILGVDGNTVRVGVEAPKDKAISRDDMISGPLKAQIIKAMQHK